MRLYVDMDGVLTDFSKQAAELLGTPLDRTKKIGNDGAAWAKITAAGEPFWADMEWMPDGHDLWEEVKKYDPMILTSPARHEASVKGKQTWLKKNLPGVPYIIEPEKDKYSDTDAILIDDSDKNIKTWRKKGGIGILHENAEDSIKKLRKAIAREKTSSEMIRNVIDRFVER